MVWLQVGIDKFAGAGVTVSIANKKRGLETVILVVALALFWLVLATFTFPWAVVQSVIP